MISADDVDRRETRVPGTSARPLSVTAGLRRSSRTTSRQRSCCRPIRSRVPTTRKPARSCRARLAAFSGKTPDWMVQIPAASQEAISARSSACPTPRPAASGRT